MPMRLIDGFATTPALSEIFSDASILRAMLRFETALAAAQARLKMIPPGAAAAIAGIQSIAADSLAEDARASATLAVPFVKTLAGRVREIDPQAADFVHWGATSQDLLDTALILQLREAREILSAGHARLSRDLRDLSDRHANTVMLARTLLQPAPPITFGYKAAAWFGAVERSWQRVSTAFDESIQIQFGGAAGTLASYFDRGPELARELAQELHLPDPPAPWHAHRDRLASLVAQCGIYSGALAKIARDIALLMQPEIGELSEPGGESSAMPNKRNPSGCVVALAAASRVPGLVASFLSALPQEHERAAGGWQSEWPTIAAAIQSTGSALAAVAETIAHLRIDPARMLANIQATHGAVFAEKAAMLSGKNAAREALSKGKLSGEHPEDYLGSAEFFRRRLLEGK